MGNTDNDFLRDLEEQRISEEISYQFYEKAINCVEFIGPQKQFKEMMWEEFNHVKVLTDKYVELGGGDTAEYNVKVHGGLALPSPELGTQVALDIGIKEEMESVAKYDRLSAKHKGHEHCNLFIDLANDERKHLDVWQRTQLEYISARSEPFGKPEIHENYRFSPEDLNVIDQAVKEWKDGFSVFFNNAHWLHLYESRDVIVSIARRESEHLSLLENEYFRLNDINPENNQSSGAVKISEENDNSSNRKEILGQIIDNEKRRLTALSDWFSKCTNSHLKNIFSKIMNDKDADLKLWDEMFQKI